MDRIPVRKIRHCGEHLGASFQVLASIGHLATFRAWATDGGVRFDYKQYGNDIPLPCPIPAEFADAMARCLASAAKAASD